MKQCPQCRQSFSDDTLFCLSDGTPLNFVDEMPEQVTVVRPAVVHIPPPSVQVPVRQGVSPIFVYLTIGLLLILLGGGVIGLAAFVISKMSGTTTEIAQDTNKPSANFTLPKRDDGQNKINEEKANLQRQKDQVEKEKQRLADERKKLEEEKTKPVETPTPSPTPPPTVNYPPQPTARITFGRGRASGTVSGKVYTQRSFVLEARSGQYLSASVSGGSCVAFSNGSSSIGYTTGSGDNKITIVNNCNTESSFSLTVSIK